MSPWGQPVGGYSSSIPLWLGCYSQDDMRQGVWNIIREAVELWREVTSETASPRSTIFDAALDQ